MITQKRLTFSAILVAILLIGSAGAYDPADDTNTPESTYPDDSVAQVHTVYGFTTDKGRVDSGIAGVKYVNTAVDIAGNAAAAAEAHAAASGDAAMAAKKSAQDAQGSADKAAESAANAVKTVATALSTAQAADSKANTAIDTANQALTAASTAQDSAAASAKTASDSADAAAGSATKAEDAWNKFSNNGGSVGNRSVPVYMQNGALSTVTQTSIPIGGATYDTTKGWATMWIN